MLIQGPPGTGKTKTIVGMIKLLFETYLKDSKLKVQVCAPSNTAIDEILGRVI